MLKTLCIEYDMKKISEKFFRKYIVNISLCLMLVIVASLTILGTTTQVFGSNGYSAYYRGNEKNNNVSLMFNVYMGEEVIPDILDVLSSNSVKVTFFVGGSWAIKHTELLQEILNQGHEIGNHGYWHKDHKTLSVEKNMSEIGLTHEVIKQTLNYEMTLFAPPSGSYGQNTLKVAQDMGYKTIMWSKDTIDWRDHDAGLIATRATKNPQNGDLILMHPTASTLKALPEIITFYTQSGYKLTTVSENIL